MLLDRSPGEREGFETSFHDDTYAFAHRDRYLTIHLGVAMGAQPATFAGLAGMGDLMATCMSPTVAIAPWANNSAEGDVLKTSWQRCTWLPRV
jgi:hypothetical protein